MQIQEFRYYRKKFEKSQRAKAELDGEGKGRLDLNEEMFDPRTMQQQIAEEKALKRGRKLDENMMLKICDLGNGCWAHHHSPT